MSTLVKCWLFAAAFACGIDATAQPHLPGFVVAADLRFDPAVQRMIAERQLKVLPIYDGALFYIVPEPSSAHDEAMQIRYIEALLTRREQLNEPDSK